MDTHWFPLLIQRWNGKADEAALESFCATVDGAARRARLENTSYATVVLSATQADVDGTQRRRLARWVRSTPPELRERNAGVYIVIASPMQRGTISALRWLVPEMKDVFGAENVDAALAAALAALADRGAQVSGTPAEIRSYIG
ncbi:MAG TPA: hypothetical protein VI072_20980 [Polyangiaceae bacterium]